MAGKTWQRIVAEVRGIARNFARNTAGNTLAIMAASLIPLAAFSGSAIDMARLYVVKVRLQQACDAGALAGRRALTDLSPSTAIDAAAKTSAETFFDNNFKSGWFNTNTVTRKYTKVVDPKDVTTANIVQGSASVIVPMSMMAMFGVTDRTLNVTCQAKYDVPDLDIMFVLDTTGSMACLPSDAQSTCDSYASGTSYVKSDSLGYYVTEKSGSRIAGLRSAVASFFDTVTSQASATTNMRFGFVPYSATVNVGSLLVPLGYMYTGNWTYQSRAVYGDANSGAALTNQTLSASNQTACNALNNTRNPATGWTSSGTAVKYSSVTWSSGTCKGTVQNLIPNWQYNPQTFNVSSYVASLAGAAVDNPAQVTSATSKWNGCIEERGTTLGMASAGTSAPSGDYDLDVDTVPSSSNAATMWKPMWGDVEFDRVSNGELSSATRTVTGRKYGSSIIDTYAIYTNELPCPAAASAIDKMVLPAGSSSSVKASLKTTMTNYMLASNGFRPYGVTYHDVGMTWGTRLLTPALFPVAAKPWTDGNELERYIIFMTDGKMEPDAAAYTSHGMEEYDQRVTGGATGNLISYHTNRFQTACAIAKSHNIHVFLIAFASSITTADFQTMKSCATTPADAYYATDTTGLTSAFTQIANKIGSLRLNK